MYSISFNKVNPKFHLNLYYNGANSYLFVNGTNIPYKIIPYNLCAENIAKDFPTTNMKKLDLMVTFMTLVMTIIQLILIT